MVILFLIFASGCQKESNPSETSVSPPTLFSVNLDIVFGEAEMKANLTKHSSQKYEVRMLSPEIMKPLSLLYENGICKVTYDGLTFETDIKRFPQSESGALLIQALTDTDGGITTKTITEDGNIIYKGTTDYGEFVLTQDAVSGLWKEFSVDGASLKIKFSDYTTN